MGTKEINVQHHCLLFLWKRDKVPPLTSSQYDKNVVKIQIAKENVRKAKPVQHQWDSLVGTLTGLGTEYCNYNFDSNFLWIIQEVSIKNMRLHVWILSLYGIEPHS